MFRVWANWCFHTGGLAPFVWPLFWLQCWALCLYNKALGPEHSASALRGRGRRISAFEAS
ncbi:rCG33229 [Rattus norvegicus]|uniref:RCG33229 n=1 Tax=Rattus norvegicus TaxID=10116 RepID=A6HDC8_RAT|nr:rCG33229 [Rattus norvegicus]